MKLLRFTFPILALVIGALLTFPPLAAAQVDDHLLCYHMTDPLAFPKPPNSTTADLLAQLQPDFSQQGCTIVKPFEFCVPATKQNVQNPPNPLADINGQTLTNDYVCYLVKCPKPTVPDRLVADQFGTRLQRNYKPFKVCVPAQKAPQPCGQTTSSARSCGGTCDDPTQVCQFDKTRKMCGCGGTQQCMGSKPDAAGQCGGAGCPTNTTCQKVVAANGTVTCGCAPLPPPGCEGSTPQSSSDGTLVCGGSCPNSNDQCVFDPGSSLCHCQPVETGCAGTTAAQCTNQPCQGSPQLVCTFDSLIKQCRCEPPAQDCAPNPFANGQCPVNTNCPAGSKCTFVPTSGAPGGTCQCK